MTTFSSSVTRKTNQPFVRYGPDSRPLVVTLESIGGQGEFISIRLLRRREPLRIAVDDLYAMLVRREVDKKRMEQVRSRIGKKPRRVKRK